MCLWLLTACLGLLPSNPSQNAQIVIVQGVPAPILQPTAAPTTVPTIVTPTAAPTTVPTTVTATAAPTTVPTTVKPTAAPTTVPTTAKPTAAPTTVPTTASATAATTMATTKMPSPSPTSATMSSAPPTPMTTMMTTAQPTTVTVAPTTAAPTTAPTTRATSPGQLPIDPRLGSTPAAEFRLPSIEYSQANPSFDSAVKFPREKRSIKENQVAEYVYSNLSNHRIRKRQSNCRCVPSGTCIRSSGNGLIDIRIVTPTMMPCPAGQEYCCGATTTATIACGTLQTPPSPVVTPAAGQANFGEYPWQALILTKQNDYIAGGVLINQLNVITVIHRLSTYIVAGTAPNVKVRLGEWDAAGTYEPVPFQEYTVTKVFTHPSFNPNTLQYDIAVLRLSASVPLTPMTGSTMTINRACLPPASTTTYTGQRCWVAGWGKDMFGMQGQFQQILKEVDVPIVAPATCQTQLQAARLGPTYVLDTTSFVCAGGEANKDSCSGDGGSGLVCQVQGQWVVVGLVAWGLGCASANVPAAYVNVAALLPWIQQQVATA
ncbi:phenoloxidase-activating factor 2-like isoform X1 [Pieris napi]|uniref:phenoloxidase-activating factor 2-like isoform X1 n=1 Tax=Pieris napi TaxID=78633 RepID=UPI001FBA96A4|nr:phenoloxidase-activating factor 2-like isoform X1 [Pieris napi]